MAWTVRCGDSDMVPFHRHRGPCGRGRGQWALRPELPVQRAVLDRFGDVLAGDVLRAGQVGNRAGDLQDAVVGAGAEVQIGHGELQQLHRRLIQRAVALQLAAAHAGVAGDLRLVLEPRLLPLARRDDPLANLRGRLAGPLAGDLAELHRRHFDVQVNAVEQRTGDAAQVILNLARRAARFAGHFAVGRRIHGGHQHELGGKGHRARGARDGDAAFFQRLAHGLQDAALELGQFVQEQHAVVREGDFAGRGIDVAAQQAGVAGGVMRRAERAARHQRLAGRQQADDAVNLGGLQRLLQRERRQDGRQPLGQHGFARARRADQQHVVPAGGGDLQRALDRFLPFDLGEVHLVLVVLVEDAARCPPWSARS